MFLEEGQCNLPNYIIHGYIQFMHVLWYKQYDIFHIAAYGANNMISSI